MGKMTLEQLRKFRDERKKDFLLRDTDGKEIRVTIGMGTCGIAAGAKKTLDELVRLVGQHGLASQVVVRQTGCMGLCYVEPTVEVSMPGMPTVIYGKMTADVAHELVEKHLIGKALLDAHIFDRPASDVVTDATGAEAVKGGK